MVVNQTECTRLEQSSAIKFLVVEEYKQCEIYGKMCDVYEEAFFKLEKKTRLQMGLIWLCLYE